jgi:Kef-type K+ transport system membrane component KefB
VLEGIFEQVALVLVIAVALGAIAARMRQPLIISFIVAGILAGPQAFGLIEEPAEIELLATIGISILLFVVGLKLDVRLVRVLGPVALATGLGQVAFTSAIGYVIALALGFGTVESLYIAVALTFSSTIIIVKLLSDKRETEELHGRIAIGFLIVQDIVVVLVMIGLAAFGDPGEQGMLLEAALVFVRGFAFLAVIGVFMRWVLPSLLHRIARLPELLVLFAIMWAVALAAAGDLLGFSEEVGAFLAGVSIASTPFREAIAGRLTSLRDFLLLFFFIDLGAGLDLGGAGELLGPAVILSLFVLIGNPIIVLVIMGFMGYRKRVSFLAGLTVAQISEFSLILASLGLALGHIGRDTVGLITAVGLITIGLSTYLIYNSQAIYERLAPLLVVFERSQPHEGPTLAATHRPPDIIVVGLGRFGSAIMEHLHASDVAVLGVDFDPQALQRWQDRGVPGVYGDAEDPELPGALPLSQTRWVVGTTRRLDTNLGLLHGLQAHGYQGRVAVSSDDPLDTDRLLEAGADVVLHPFEDAAGEAARVLR